MKKIAGIFREQSACGGVQLGLGPDLAVGRKVDVAFGAKIVQLGGCAAGRFRVRAHRAENYRPAAVADLTWSNASNTGLAIQAFGGAA